MDPAVTCCFSGHRPARLPWGDNETDPRCLRLKKRIRAALDRAYAQGYRHFLCGMAQGSDLYFCEALLDLRAEHPDVTIEAAIPFVDQAHRWPQADQLRRQTLLDQCNYETMVQHHYTSGCLARRNRYMVNHSTLLIAAYDGTPHGGTHNTLLYALRQNCGVDIVEIE